MWRQFFLSLGQGAAQGFIGATQQPGASIKNAGIAAGLSAAFNAVNWVASHPAAQHPDVVAGTSAKVSVSTDGGQTYQPTAAATAAV
jgi:hypothetical protein